MNSTNAFFGVTYGGSRRMTFVRAVPTTNPFASNSFCTGDAARFDLPRPMKGRPGCDLSFSGLKTAVRQWVDRLTRSGAALAPQDVADLAAGLQAAIGDSLVDRTANAIDLFRARHPDGETLVAAGGVAANAALRERLARLAAGRGMGFVAPPLALCTDNAAMIASAARFAEPIPYPGYLALDAYASTA